MNNPPFLNGYWTFNRTIDDRHQGQTLMLTGTLSVDNNTWFEQGVQNNTPFTQKYVMEFNGDTVLIKFPDGRLFYRLDNQKQNTIIEHLCGDDMYRGKYQYENENTFTLVWIVNGPRKNYTMRTTYTRL